MRSCGTTTRRQDTLPYIVYIREKQTRINHIDQQDDVKPELMKNA